MLALPAALLPAQQDDLPAPPALEAAPAGAAPEEVLEKAVRGGWGNAVDAAAFSNAENTTPEDPPEEPFEETVEEAEETIIKFSQRLAAALGIIAVQVFLILLIWNHLYVRFERKIMDWGKDNIKPLVIKKLKILTVPQILNAIAFLLRILKYVVTAFQLFITLPMIFVLFPQTRHIANQIVGHTLAPIKNIFFGIIGYLPNLITIVIILWVTRYALRGLKFFATRIEKGRLVIKGFYPDWTWPTFNILRVLLYAFTIIMVYPYLPGSGSPIFQGVSVFAGIILSLGSSSAIGNIIAGLVITYMRPFRIGDRIRIGEVTGFVEQKSLIVIKIRTHKNELVTFPNTMILSSNITNYHTSTDEEKEALILYTEVTMNYQVPWRTVHEIMIGAAQKTEGIEKDPTPFVLQTALDDFYARYQINAYTREADRIPAIYSALYQNIQDGFSGAGIDLTAPAYRINLPAESHKAPPQGR